MKFNKRFIKYLKKEVENQRQSSVERKCSNGRHIGEGT